MRAFGGRFQLPTGGHDIFAARGSDGAGIARLVDDIGKTLDLVPIRPLIGGARPFVERDQVDLGGDARNQLDQTAGIIVAVIDALEHHIFKGNPLGIAGLWIGPQGIKQGLDIPALIDRHKLIAHGIGGRVKADGQHAADFLGGARDLGHHARCG